MSATAVALSTYAGALWSNATANSKTALGYSSLSNTTALNCEPCTVFQFEPGIATWSSTAPVEVLATTQLIVDPNSNTTSTSITCNTAVLDSYKPDYDRKFSLNDECELVATYVAAYGSDGTAGFQWATATLTEPSGIHIQVGGNVAAHGEISTTDAKGKAICTTFNTYYSTPLGVYTGPLTTNVSATWTQTGTYTFAAPNATSLSTYTMTQTADGGLWLMPALTDYFPGLAAVSQCGPYIAPGGVPLALQPASYVTLPVSTLPRTLPSPPSTTLVSNGPTSKPAKPGNSPVTALPQVTDGPQPTLQQGAIGGSSANNAASPSAGRPAPSAGTEPTGVVVVPVVLPSKSYKPSPANAVEVLDSALASLTSSTVGDPHVALGLASYIVSVIATEKGAPSAAPHWSVVPGVPGGYVVGESRTIQAGGSPATVSSITFSALPFGQGVAVNEDGISRTLSRQDIGSGGYSGVGIGAINDAPTFVFGEHSISAGGDALTNAGTAYSALPSGKGVLVSANGVQSTIPYAALVTSAPQIGASGQSGENLGYAIDDITLSAGGTALTTLGTIYSALPSGMGVFVSANGAQSTMPMGAMISNSAQAVAVAEADADSAYIVGGTTLSAGGPAMTTLGRVYSALPDGLGVLATSEGGRSTITPGGSVDGLSVSLATNVSPDYVIAGTTVSAGSPAVTSAGVVYTALPSGRGVLEISNGETSTLHPLIVTSLATLPRVTATGSDYIVGDTMTLTPGGLDTVVSGTVYTALASGSGVLVSAHGLTTTLKAVRSSATATVTLEGSATASIDATATDGSEAATSGAERPGLRFALWSAVAAALLLCSYGTSVL